MSSFKELGLAAPILSALSDEGYEKPTPIQAQAIPLVLAGNDLMGIAQTGTGKTAAFTLPILHHLATGQGRTAPRTCRVLILSPTRELASQIADSVRAYSRHLRLSVATVFGGVSAGPQARMLERGVDVLVATPGRLLDHMGAGALRLNAVETFVLDEADQMLDMGFIHSIRKLVKQLPQKRQTLFFSATMPKEIATLAGELLNNPKHVAVTPVSTTAERVNQKVIFVEAARKRHELAHVLTTECDGRTLVFTRTKHGADRVVRHLDQVGVTSAAIHGNKSQGQRQRALDNFRHGSTRVLVATDIAARGIDVDGVTHVINFELPNVPETYVHRIGRTARAGASGSAISFCDREERPLLKQIERLTRQTIEVAPASAPEPAPAELAAARQDVERDRQEQERRNSRQPRGRSGNGGGGRGQGSGEPRAASNAPRRPDGQRNGRSQEAGRSDGGRQNAPRAPETRAPRAPGRNGGDAGRNQGQDHEGRRNNNNNNNNRRRDGEGGGQGADLAGVGFMRSR